ncbi:MAG TPA: DNA-binding response regulator [Lachnospiraceae bacterium]|nr:DNA-binding response regulator [Lachnospiraceae bacterium]
MCMRRIEHYNVLIADDEFHMRQALNRKITELDDSFRVVCECAEGLSALSALAGTDIQVVFTDIRMPGMDGLRLAGEIQERFPDIVTVILTGYADFEYAKEAIHKGVFDYLLKPVSEEELSGVLEKIALKLSELYELQGEDLLSGKSAGDTALFLKQYLKKNFRTEVDLGEVASRFGFTSAYLSRIFSKEYGESPSRYLTRIRIEEAKKLLVSTNEPVARVGELSGYPDQFYFSRTFRKETGENPTAYRKTRA